MKITLEQLQQRLSNLNTLQITADQDQLGKRIVTENPDQLTPAGVLVPLVNRPVNGRDNLHVLLTKRASHLKHHPGQVSFPGGRQETTDQDLIDTALRETFEEIGIDNNLITILAELPKHQTISGYLMCPFVGIVSNNYSLTIDRSEVDSAFEVPLDFICDSSNHQLNSAVYNGERRHFYSMQYQQHYIWGATARVLVEFSNRVILASD
ncbi:MAG: CoA pyrophosphatase [Kangiellaceae bacterium]|jgi:8-oxo-dGTP pyrophosphatase MutT (NUDIX family)|nr:CoA pyrophosphatase [Kangiellaceae bacterium]